MSLVDLHLHLLPGVDDGARDERSAIDHARRLVAEGIREVAVTPHIGSQFPLRIASIARRTAALQSRLFAEEIGLRLHPGGEIHPRHVDELADSDLARIAHGPAGSRWVLLEAPFAGIDDAFGESVARLRDRGYGTLIGHPERAKDFLADGLTRLRPQLQQGAVLQISADSLAGDQGFEAQEGARRLLRAGLAFVISSDGHPGTRDQTVADGAAAAARLGLSDIAIWRLTDTNPRFLLRDGLPRVPLAVPVPLTA